MLDCICGLLPVAHTEDACVQGSVPAQAQTQVQEVDPILLDEINAMDNYIQALDIKRTGLIEQAHRTQTGKYKKEKLLAQAAHIEMQVAKLSGRVAKLRAKMEDESYGRQR